MIGYLVLVAAAGVLALRLWQRRRRRLPADRPSGAVVWTPAGDVGLVAAREIRERLRGRIFRVGTVLILATVAAAIIIPTLTGGAPSPQRVGVVGALSAPTRATVAASAHAVGTSVQFVPEPDAAAARADLRSGALDLVIAEGRVLVTDKSLAATDTSTTAEFVHAVAKSFGLAAAVAAAHLSSAQAAALAHATPVPVHSLSPGTTKGASRTTSVVGLILVFLMLNQYNTWILMGVMEEKSSRVVEVLLAALRPIQLLSGKVLGIGVLALAQATLIVAVALVLADAVGSDLLRGTAPLVVVSTLVWLVLGYAFYCWVYAAAGSLAERQDQVQSLVLPLSLPIIFGYIMGLTTAASGSASLFFQVLAYLPPTAPFAMPVLVGFGAVSVWGFLASVAITIGCTIGVARVAAAIYRRAILRTGGRVRLRDVLSRASG